MSKSVYDDFQERSEAIGSKGVVVKAGLEYNFRRSDAKWKAYREQEQK